MMKGKAGLLALAWAIGFWGNGLQADIRFQEVTGDAGIAHAGPTYGVSWGDLNGDGWPDIWIGNHLLDRNVPVLYLNNRDGTFKDVTRAVVAVDPLADLHGAAWADFDGDGDQDLLSTAGGGGGWDEASSPSDNHLFVNDNGVLRNEARRFGLLDPLGRGRSPLWLDADKDGRLDVLLSNHPRKDGKAPTAIHRQGDGGFQSANAKFGFVPTALSTKEKLADLLYNIAHLRPKFARPSLNAREFAQLADLDADGEPELLSYLAPLRIFSMGTLPFSDITAKFDMPDTNGIRDVAVEDFTGDAQPDIYLARSRHGSDFVQPSEFELAAHFDQPLSLRFRSAGEVTFGIYPPWVNPVIPDPQKPKLQIGKSVETLLSAASLTLTAGDARLAEPAEPVGKGLQRVSIGYDTATQSWTLASTLPHMNLVIRSSQPLQSVEAVKFTPSRGESMDVLLVNQGKLRFRSQASELIGIGPSACDSVAAGDFDNDMDMDLYLVCTGPVANLSNILLENNGAGRFVAVPNAGGAAGSKLGRGDAVAVADYDRDGFLDLFVTNGADLEPFSDAGPYQLFRNRGNSNHWLEIDLQGVNSNRDGIGATLAVEAGGVRQIRTQGGGMHDHAQNHQRIHVGLGANAKADKLSVRWPDGHVQILTEVEADRIVLIREEAPKVSKGSAPLD